MIATLCGVVLILAGVLGVAMLQIDGMRRQLDSERDLSQRFRLEVVDVLTSIHNTRVEATALRQAALDYDSLHGQNTLARLRREHIADGRSIPAKWLLHRAAEVEGATTEEVVL